MSPASYSAASELIAASLLQEEPVTVPWSALLMAELTAVVRPRALTERFNEFRGYVLKPEPKIWTVRLSHRLSKDQQAVLEGLRQQGTQRRYPERHLNALIARGLVVQEADGPRAVSFYEGLLDGFDPVPPIVEAYTPPSTEPARRTVGAALRESRLVCTGQFVIETFREDCWIQIGRFAGKVNLRFCGPKDGRWTPWTRWSADVELTPEEYALMGRLVFLEDADQLPPTRGLLC